MEKTSKEIIDLKEKYGLKNFNEFFLIKASYETNLIVFRNGIYLGMDSKNLKMDLIPKINFN